MTNETEQGRESEGKLAEELREIVNQYKIARGESDIHRKSSNKMLQITLESLLILAGLLGGIHIGQQEMTRAYEQQLRGARIEDVNQDGRSDLQIGDKLYIQTDKGLVPANEYFGGKENENL